MKKIITLAGAISFATLFAQPAGAISYQCTTASYYGHGDGYENGITASGERLRSDALSTAHRSLPFGTKLLVKNQANGRSVVVRVNDRGPFVAGRDLDLNYGAFAKIAPVSQGVAKVCYSII